MSSSRKMLKIVSMVAVLASLGFLVCGVALAACGLGGGTAVSGTPMAPVYGGISAVTAVSIALMGLAGMRAANVPSKVGASHALTMWCLLVMVANVGFWAWQGFSSLDTANGAMLAIGIALSGSSFVFAGQVKKERELWH